MKTLPTIGKMAAALLLAGVAAAWAVGGRVGGTAEITCESLNSGGISYATHGSFTLGGSLGQSGFVQVGTGGVSEVQSGFWKLEDGCEMYPFSISQMVKATNSIAITFNLMRSNLYSVAYLNTEGGGLTNGTHVWTNIVAGPVSTEGGIGSTTTLYVNASLVTNAGRFFLIQCEVP
jgi:hypothetical protein